MRLRRKDGVDYRGCEDLRLVASYWVLSHCTGPHVRHKSMHSKTHAQMVYLEQPRRVVVPRRDASKHMTIKIGVIAWCSGLFPQIYVCVHRIVYLL